jgi:branched-chain amino acid transport system substrate-binding protein
MTANMTRPGLRRLAAVAVSAIAALGVAACGSSSSSGGSSSSAATSSPAATTSAATSSAAGTSSAASGTSAAAPASYVKYVGGTAGAADPSKSPIEIGYVNDQGGSTVIAGPDPTTGAQAGVTWINKYAGGIDGHPLKLVTCFVKNAEAEGQTCAQQFLANPKISVIAYGAMALGASTIDSTVAGKKPIIEGVSINPPDLKTKNTYVLFAAVPYIDYPWATYAKQFLHAKTAAVLYPNQTGQQIVEQAVVQALKAEGIKSKLVGFDPNSSDLTGALEAAGAPSADFISTNAATPSQCLAFAKSMQTLNIDAGKVLGLFQCQVPSIKAQYPGGDYPKWAYSVADAGVEYQSGAAGDTFRGVFKALGVTPGDPWLLVDYSQILTIGKFMNAVGADKVSPSAIAAQASQFKGPVLLGPNTESCGKYPSAPAVCADGDAFFKYAGNGSFKLLSSWLETPPALQKQLGATTVTP